MNEKEAVVTVYTLAFAAVIISPALAVFLARVFMIWDERRRKGPKK